MPTFVPFAGANIAVPDVGGGLQFSFTDTLLEDYIALAVGPGQTAVNLLGSYSNVPLLSFNRSGSLIGYNVYIEVTPSNTAAESWELHFSAWYPVLVGDDLYVVGQTADTLSTKCMSGTHGATTNQKVSFYSVISDLVETGIGSGGGTTTVFPAAASMPLVAPYVILDFKNIGATTTFTIDGIRIWGIIRERS